MQTTSKRSVDPTSIELTISFDEADVDAAFYQQQDPDALLFFQVFSSLWTHLSAVDKLRALSEVARLVDQATSLNLTPSAPVPK